jgi:hypothetical protein
MTKGHTAKSLATRSANVAKAAASTALAHKTSIGGKLMNGLADHKPHATKKK